MSTHTVSIRRARSDDAGMLSAVFDAAWRGAYRGVIPGVALERMLARRGPASWRAMAGRGRSLVAVEFGDAIVGYAAYGRARDRMLRADGEIDEIYIAPDYQGLGLGSRLFRAVRNDLRDRALPRVGLWSLTDNPRARGFYERLGGRAGARSVEHASGARLPTVAYLFA